MEIIEIEYLPQLKDYIEAYKLYESKTIMRKIDKIVAIGLFILGIIFLSLSINHGHIISGIILSIIFIIIGIFDFLGFIDLGKIVISIQFRKSSKLKYIQKIKFDENGFEYETNGINSKIEWKFYNKYYEGENIFLLVYGNRQYSVIPKYPFANKINDFKKIIESCIK